MNTAAIYARVSTAEQVKGTSLDGQVALCQEYAKEHGFTVIKVVQEDASGARLDRPKLGELRNMAERREIEALIVFDPDRLSRSMAHTMMLMEEFERNRADVLFVNAPREDTPEGEMLFGMRALFAQYERTKIAERTRRGKERRIREGQVMMSRSCSYGYEYIAAEKRIRVLESEAVWVRKMYEWMVYEGCSLREIARRLDANCVPTRTRAKQWLPNTIQRILLNEVYAGTWHYGKYRAVEPKSRRVQNGKHSKSSRESRPPEEWLPVPVPAVISQELYDAVQAQLDHNRAMSKRNTKHEYLLRGLLTCAGCGYKMHGHRIAGHHKPGSEPHDYYEYYECPGRTKRPLQVALGRVCDQPYIPVRRLETIVWDEVVRQLSDEGRLRKKIEELEEARRRGRKDAETELEVLTNLELGLKRETNTLLDLHMDGTIDKSTLQERMSVVREKQANIARSKAEVIAQLAQSDQGPGSEEAIKELCEIARLGLPAATFEEKRAFLEGMGVTLRASQNRITITGLITERTLAVPLNGLSSLSSSDATTRYLLCNSHQRR